ncbi:AMP-binding protein [Zafaria sp. J156]|uniref:AMP-binding protein n=1 Tax=Zafaria sp. J156 TaxID=3116490 RepID=UPI003D35C812
MTHHAAYAATDSHTAGDAELPVLRQTIGAHFRAVAATHPDAPAIIEASTGRRWSYAAMDRDTELLARALLAAGLASGDRLGLWSPNCAEWTLLQYATAKAGIILVNVNPAYRTHELAYVVEQCGMAMLVAAPADANSDYPAMAREVAAGAPGLRALVLLPEPGADTGLGDHVATGDPGAVTAAGDVRDASTAEADDPDAATAAASSASGDSIAAPTGPELTWRQLLDGAAGVEQARLDAILESLDPDDAINLQYTSGTTGFPKGATLSHANILNNGFHIGELLAYTTSDRVVLPVPFFHCFGMVIGNLAAFSHGAATILPGRSFKPAEALRAVQEHGGTSLYGVPTMFIAELALPDFAEYDLSTLRTGVMAGSPCPVEVMKRVIDEMHMSGVAICYGMTETSPVSTMTRAGDSLEKRTQTVGRTMPALESKIVDPATGVVVPRGTTGELCTRGYAVMKCYWNDPEKTAQAVDADGWMHTGDLAAMDDDGYVRIEGRIKDMVIRGGENISPREIEEFLYGHPSIRDVQVIGVPDEKYGEELMACVILKDGAKPFGLEELRAFCAGRIAHYKVPRYLQVRESFPMTVSGKVRKVEMRREAAESLGALER